MKIVQVYPQAFQHQPLKIIGNREGLIALMDAIHTAVYEAPQGKWQTPEGPDCFFASDGEGYSVIIEMHNDQWEANKVGDSFVAPKDSYWYTEEAKPFYAAAFLCEQDTKPVKLARRQMKP